jgi:hypothetical protein
MHLIRADAPNIKDLSFSKIKELYADMFLLKPKKRWGLIKDISQGINSNPVQMHLIVQVSSGRSASIAYEGNCFTPFNILALFYKGLAEMGIPGDHTIAMADGYHLSISTVTIDFGYNPICRGNDGCTHSGGDVNPPVEFLFARKGRHPIPES